MTTLVGAAATEQDVPDENTGDARLLTHSYDGIREYDNPLPGWWSLIFAVSIGFAAAYGFYFHVVHWGAMPDERYAAALVRYESNRDVRAAAEAANVSEETLANSARNSEAVSRGAALFAQRCVSCHLDKGQGVIGPNLTDLNQLHGATRMDLYKTIANGVPGTAMLAWGEQLPQTDILALAAFASTLRGQNVPGKEPQGRPVERFAR